MFELAISKWKPYWKRFCCGFEPTSSAWKSRTLLPNTGIWCPRQTYRNTKTTITQKQKQTSSDQLVWTYSSDDGIRSRYEHCYLHSWRRALGKRAGCINEGPSRTQRQLEAGPGRFKSNAILLRATSSLYKWFRDTTPKVVLPLTVQTELSIATQHEIGIGHINNVSVYIV